MKLKKPISIILSSVMFFSLVGCSNKNIQVSNNPETIKKIEVTINSEINKYSPLMSSTPGLPLAVDIRPITKKGDIKYHWVTEQGIFLDWKQDSGKINILGKDAESIEQKIYWSVDLNEEIKKSTFKIYLKIKDTDTSKVIYETSIEVEQDKEGFFSIKK
jgi:hypothetical protein